MQDIRAPGLVFVHEHHAVGFLCFGALRRNEHHPFVYLFIFDAGEVQPAFLDHFIERLEVIVPLARHGDGAHLRGSGVHFDAIPLQERRHVLRAGDLLRKRAALRGRIHCVALVAHHAHGNGRACQHHAADGHHSQFPQPALA